MKTSMGNPGGIRSLVRPTQNKVFNTEINLIQMELEALDCIYVAPDGDQSQALLNI